MALERKGTAVDEVMGEDDARRIIQVCIENYNRKCETDLR
jgi:inorganic pyrophosphatase